MNYDPRQAKAAAAAAKARVKAMRPWYKKKRFLIPLALVVLLIIAAAGSGSDDEAKMAGTVGDVPRSEDAPPLTGGGGETPGSEFRVGEVVTRGRLQAAVLSVVPNVPPPNEFDRPAAGKKIVAVELQVQNNGNRPEHISTLLQFKLRDSTNAQYDIRFSGGRDPAFPEGEVSPGTANRGFVAFEVPQRATGLKFVFDANVFGGGRITWNLGV